jgi:3',5'-cyclic AMP phosphodiesterase CpdA
MNKIKFAIFTDLHYEHIHDGRQRIENFVSEIDHKDVDFIVELGDFCSPKQENRVLLDILDSTGKPHYHLVGNHDSDLFTKEEFLHFLGMNNSYYSFTYGSVKFIALDTCFIQNSCGYEPYSKKNYNTTKGIYPVIPQDELNWLEDQLADDYPFFVILSHHSLENEFAQRGVYNRNAVQELINRANSSGKKVLLCLNGHDHADSIRKIEETYYFGLNSMSYIWFGPEYEHFCYSPEIHKQYPFLKDMVLYREGLYAIITITEQGSIEVEGMEGHYQTISPEELGLKGVWNGRDITPDISSLMIK